MSREITSLASCVYCLSCSAVLSFCVYKHIPIPEGDAYFTVKLHDYTAVEKDKVVLDCELNKNVDVMWYHNEAEIKPSKMVTIKADGKRRTLTISRLADKDKGQYVCDCGTDKTSARLHIKGKNKEHGSLICEETTFANLMCTFGKPSVALFLKLCHQLQLSAIKPSLSLVSWLSQMTNSSGTFPFLLFFHRITLLLLSKGSHHCCWSLVAEENVPRTMNPGDFSPLWELYMH